MSKTISDKVLWSIALPGFGQLLNGKYLKGLLFIALEFLINVYSGLNEVIMLSFQGQIAEAVDRTNYEWLMFYPCVYMFAIWDAYRDAKGQLPSTATLPFVLGAYFGTVGIIYSSSFTLGGKLLGPVWLGMFAYGVGALLGYVLYRALRQRGT
ncbi:hypothetical protein RAC89_22315 [Paenibacillus sp. GD4]|uniref:hypothetical protein n=1 Tax=Paenibacillus sp. GD4 TaxID=3068890 RepID=UPI00279685E0|nr:hypothetical protein [Paenibacillus sp. GD4]MDQ1913133.1 hypothetical protein [Paenibacillus sp. GD4]